MAHNDETLWICLKQFSCSFKVKMDAPKQDFCRNQYNFNGLCTKASCPLANSQYATIMEHEGIMYLYMKTVERAHSPKNLWERVKLSRNFLEALDQISRHLEYWPDWMVNRVKQRLTRMRQVLIRTRKLSLKEAPRMVPIKKKTEKREMARELKAETAAKVDLQIEKELLERLKQGTYGDIYNFPKLQISQVEEAENEQEGVSDLEYEEDLEDDEDDYEEQDVDKIEQVEIDDSLADMEDFEHFVGPAKKRRRGPRVELEYEQEVEAN